MIRPALVIVLAIGLMTGCSTLQLRDRMQDFEETSRAYGRAITWSEYSVAAAFLKSGDQGQMGSETEHLDQFRVTAYETRLVTILEKDVRIRQVVKISYFRTNNLVVRNISDDQIWEYDPDKSSWVLTTGFPEFE